MLWWPGERSSLRCRQTPGRARSKKQEFQAKNCTIKQHFLAVFGFFWGVLPPTFSPGGPPKVSRHFFHQTGYGHFNSGIRRDFNAHKSGKSGLQGPDFASGYIHASCSQKRFTSPISSSRISPFETDDQTHFFNQLNAEVWPDLRRPI